MSYHLARKDYVQHELTEANCPNLPHELLDQWLKDAHTDSEDANAMTISTVDQNGQPSSRIVLLRELSQTGIIFFTNYNSKKGRDISKNNKVALNFFWPWMERQVRIEGVIEKVDESISDAYFDSRPRESQLGAIASSQSESLSDRKVLEDKLNALAHQFADQAIPRPTHWGGYLVRPKYFEFWQGRSSRLHDRIAYRNENDQWITGRLFP
jgi:pyridoxamine 5'-phosphate oxidase